MQLFKSLRRKLLRPLLETHALLSQDVDEVRFAVGSMRYRIAANEDVSRLEDTEFRVFSQSGEDGIIQYLVRQLGLRHGRFLEIGVADYRESNTRFLLMNNDWEGIAIDSRQDHVRFMASSGLRWRYKIDPIVSFVTTENINELVAMSEENGALDLLSVDIDGNDYWVLDAMDVPVGLRLLIVEFNSLFGPDAQVAVPYRADFDRWKAHYSGLYWGASLKALDQMLSFKGFRLVGVNQAGTNAFFVREEDTKGLFAPSVQEAFRNSRFREARGKNGEFLYLANEAEGLALIDALPVVDFGDGNERSLREVLRRSDQR